VADRWFSPDTLVSYDYQEQLYHTDIYNRLIKIFSSCGTVALYGPFFFWQTIGLQISPDQKFAELRPRIRHTFQQ
jgi:hypothetical protein